MFWRLLTFAVKTIISTSGLNFSVRNGKRCDSAVKAPEQNIQYLNMYVLRKASNIFLVHVVVLRLYVV